MLEGIGCRWNDAASQDKAGFFELLKVSRKQGGIGSCDRGQQSVVEDATDACADLGNVLDGGQSVEAGHQRILQRRRNGQWGQWTRQSIVVASLDKEVRLKDGFGKLLDKQRYAFGFVQDPVFNV